MIFEHACVLQVFLRYGHEEDLMSLVETERRRVVRVQSCARRWVATRVVSRRRELQHTHATRIQAGKHQIPPD